MFRLVLIRFIRIPKSCSHPASDICAAKLGKHSNRLRSVYSLGLKFTFSRNANEEILARRHLVFQDVMLHFLQVSYSTLPPRQAPALLQTLQRPNVNVSSHEIKSARRTNAPNKNAYLFIRFFSLKRDKHTPTK